jgi:hypothetical protein
MLLELPVKTEGIPPQVWRLNVWAIAEQLGLDTVRLESYRKAIEAGLYTDYPKEKE